MRNWTLGLLTSLLIGHVVTFLFVHGVRLRLDRLRAERRITEPAPWHGVQDIPPWLMGGLERLFFTLAVAWSVPGAVVGMIAWLALKMATDWNRTGGPAAAQVGVADEQAAAEAVARQQSAAAAAMSGLLGGLVSMLFAIAGGLICGGKLS